MSFLIFAFRKLSLKQKINNLNFKLMTLSEREQNMMEKVGNMQQSMSAVQSIMTAVGSSQMAQIQQGVMSQYYENGKLKAGVDPTLAYTAYKSATDEAMMKNSLFSSAMESQNKAQMTSLNSQSNQISSQKLTIESQLKQLNADYEQIDKAEDQAAKQGAAKFGLGG